MVARMIMNYQGTLIEYPRGSATLVRLIMRLADEGGTLQAGDMLRVTGEPERHCATSLEVALALVEAKVID